MINFGIVASITLSSWFTPFDKDINNFSMPVIGSGTVLVADNINYTQEDLAVLAKNLYFEERSKKASDIEIAQIGYVVLNRVKSSKYPNSITDVIWQYKQFSWTHDGKSDKMFNSKARERSYKIARSVLEGTIPNEVGEADHYLNRNKSKARWYVHMTFKGRFGDHWFYER